MNNSFEIIIVLYNCDLNSSKSYNSLSKNIVNYDFNYELIIYNNDPSVIIEENKNYLLVNSISNDKLSGAYNYALKRAIERHKHWLLLLDQDTEITDKYLFELNKIFQKNTVFNEFVAIIPRLVFGTMKLSPISFSPVWGPFLRHRAVLVNSKSKTCLSAYNSGVLLNTSFLKEINGFSYKYPIDMLDHWYFYQIYKSEKKVLILDAELEQNLSLLTMQDSMSIERYKSYLVSQKLFAKEIGFFGILSQKIVNVKLLLVQLIVSSKRKYVKTSLDVLLKNNNNV